MKKKKVFYLLTAMQLGGTEKALLGLLSTIDYSKTEVHLGLFHKEGDLLDYIPKQVIVNHISLNTELLGNDNVPTIGAILFYLRHKKPVPALAVSFLYFLSLFNKKYRYLLFKYILRDVPCLPDFYNEAYAFSGINELISFYVAEKVIADTKVCWIHFDVAQEPLGKAFFIQQMNHYQKIYLVSNQAKQSFDRVFPTLASKSEFHRNIVSGEQIKKLSELGESYNDDFDGTRLLTIARLSPEKGIEEALYALSDLIHAGIKVRWYFIGDGPQRNQFRQLVDYLGINSNAFFLGNKINPYKYLKDCDIYVQPSRAEGFCIALAEAICFEKPIVATDFSGAREQLLGRENSFIIGIHALTLSDGIYKMTRKLSQP